MKFVEEKVVPNLTKILLEELVNLIALNPDQPREIKTPYSLKPIMPI